MENFAKNLKKYREEADMSVSALAQKLGVSDRYVSYMERGDKIPGLKLALRIAEILGVTLDKLSGEV